MILSGDESRRSVLELLGAGAVAYLRKGVAAAEICRTLREALTVDVGPRLGRRPAVSAGEPGRAG